MKVGIIGGGITGLTAAYYLSKKNVDVTLIEKSENLGGLASSFKFQNFFLDKYYHHIFKCDNDIINLIEELGLKENLTWKETKMGFFVNGKIYLFGTPLELLKFFPLGILDRLKFGFTILYLQNLNSWNSLDKKTAEEFLKKFSGKRTYEIIWKPLLRIKFGNCAEKISAAWVWGRIKSRAKSRGKTLMKEELGYLKGGFQTLINELEKKIKRNKGKIIKEKKISKVEKVDNEKIIIFSENNEEQEFDKVIFTAANPEFLNLVSKIPKEYSKKLEKINYQSVVCATFLLKKSLSEIYWLNISDEDIPFGGVIEHTNFIPKEEYGNFSVVYLFNYIQKEKDEIYNLSDKKLIKIYKKGLKEIFPNFHDNLIENCFIHKDDFATPVYVKNYSKIKPEFETPIKNLFLANTSQIYPFDRTMNNSVKLGKEIAEKILKGKITKINPL